MVNKINNLKIYKDDIQIENAVSKVAVKICKDFDGEELVNLVILKGGIIFAADLVRSIDRRAHHYSLGNRPIEVLRVSSYDSKTTPNPTVKFDLTTSLSLLAGKSVLIIEDIVDTGNTLKAVRKHVSSLNNIESVKTCALINKLERRACDVDIEYSCFTLDKGFVVGYGLDAAEKYRSNPHLYILEESYEA